VYGRGRNSIYGDLGLSVAFDTSVDDPIPIEVSASGGGTEELSNVVDVVAGESHSCAIHDDRSMTCWGDDRYGKLSVAKFDGTTDRKKVKKVGMGTHLTCVVSYDNYMECIGITTLTYASSYDVLSIQMSNWDHGCMVLDKSDSNVLCFGRNSHGQLGIGYVSPYEHMLNPRHPSGLPHAKLVGVGPHHSCVVLDDDSQKCWGRGLKGVLGSATSGDKLTPVDVVAANAIDFGDASVIGIYASIWTTNLHLSDNRMYSWGTNENGLLAVNMANAFESTGYGGAQLAHLSTTLPTPAPSMAPSMSPSVTKTCPPDANDKAKFFIELKPKVKSCNWLKDAGTWKINRYCSMTEGYGSAQPAREVCTGTCNSCVM